MESKERLKQYGQLARLFCKDCKHEMDGCKKCWVYFIMNSIMEGQDIEVI